MVLPYPPCKLHSKVIMEEQETACLQITILWITLPKKERSRIITYRIPNEFDLFPKRCQEWHSSSSLKCSWSSTVIEQTWNMGIGKYAHYQALQPYFVLNCQSFCSVLSQDEPSDIYELARHPLHWPHSVVLFHFTPSFPHDHLRRKATNCGQLADEFTLQNLVDTAMNTLKGTSVPSRFSELSTLISNIPRCFSKRSEWLLPAQCTSGY